jgi:hypothetical protein
MKCDEIRELLSLYIDRMLDESQAREVEEHLSACSDCRKEHDDFVMISELLGETEMVPVPDEFQFRLRKALKEEKAAMIGEGILAVPAKKKNHWRIITSIAAVFAVGILSFGLYDHMNGFLPSGQKGQEQTETAKVDSTLNFTATNPAVDQYESSDGSVVMKAQAANSPQIADAAIGGGTDESRNTAKISPKIVTGNADSGVSADDTNNSQAPVYGMAAVPVQDTDGTVTTESADNSSDASLKSSTVTDTEEKCSRSLTVSGIERNAAAVQYYANLIEEKLSGFDYQILDSTYAQTGERQFRIFIFRGKDGNTYNEEILIIGKDGKIETVCTDEALGL